MRHAVAIFLLSSLVVGCASQEDLKEYAMSQSIDSRVLALGLPQLGEPISVVTVGQLVNGKAAVFTSSEEQYYLVTLASPLSGSQGREIYLLGGAEIVSGESVVTLDNRSKAKSQTDKNGIYRSPSWGFGSKTFRDFAKSTSTYEDREAIVGATFKLRDKAHAQEVADLLYR
jgi:hypothetical protein